MEKQQKKPVEENNFNFNFEAVKQSKNNFVFFGNVGSGKTTLINKLCGTNYETSSSGFSCTRIVQSSPTIRNSNIILDFPGLSSVRELVQHLVQQRDTLKVIPVRVICFILKYDNRYDLLLISIIKMINIFKHHLNNVCIIFTHSENVSLKIKAEICNVIEEEVGIVEKKIIFSTLDTSEERLSKELETIKLKMVNIEETIIESSELLKQFDMSVSLKYQECSEEFLKKFQMMMDQLTAEFDKTQDKELKRALYFSLKNVKDKVVDEFRCKLEKEYKLDVHQVVTQLVLFQNSIYNKFKKFKMLAERSLEIQSVVYNGEMNRYKKCPVCGLIWFRVYGCNGIICGRRSISRDTLFGKYLNYTIIFIGNILKITKSETNKESSFTDREVEGLTSEEIILNCTRKVQIKPQGCGAKMNWNEMEDVTEYALETLKKLEDTDFYANIDDKIRFKNNIKI